jgi:hypothetical protein
MASWSEIERVRKSAATFKPLAAQLLKLPNGNWWEYAERFLRDVSEYPYPELGRRNFFSSSATTRPLTSRIAT